MELKKAYQMVFNDLRENRMFQGHYNAANSDVQYMWGIETAMEAIAQRGYDDNFAEDFAYEFVDNMRKSKMKHKIWKEGY